MTTLLLDYTTYSPNYNYSLYSYQALPWISLSTDCILSKSNWSVHERLALKSSNVQEESRRSKRFRSKALESAFCFSRYTVTYLQSITIAVSRSICITRVCLVVARKSGTSRLTALYAPSTLLFFLL